MCYGSVVPVSVAQFGGSEPAYEKYLAVFDRAVTSFGKSAVDCGFWKSRNCCGDVSSDGGGGCCARGGSDQVSHGSVGSDNGPSGSLFESQDVVGTGLRGVYSETPGTVKVDGSVGGFRTIWHGYRLGSRRLLSTRGNYKGSCGRHVQGFSRVAGLGSSATKTGLASGFEGDRECIEKDVKGGHTGDSISHQSKEPILDRGCDAGGTGGRVSVTDERLDSVEEKAKESSLERNRRRRAERKRKRENTKASSSGNVVVDDRANNLRGSIEKKWIAQNELAAAEAKRKLAVLTAGDVQDEIRRRATQIKRHTESNMVAIEKTHKFLSATGNVAGEPAGGQGFAETIIGNSISPDSSASMQEFRAAQKQILDLQQENEKLKKAYQKAGGNPDAIDLYDKSLFTMENGTIDQRYVDQFEDLKLSWGIPEKAVEYRNGKMKTRIDFYGVKDDDDFNNFYGDC